ncbi:MAG TPA: HNH endonuclease [Cyclobacteriaceae bacterium]|nr:HNH endonuclease [Cyclobacteriaceae bacterium]
MNSKEIIDVGVTFMPDSEELGFFWKMYEIEQKFHASMAGDKQLIWGKIKKEARVCRFCKRDISATTFNKKAHAIPALMGNKTLFTDYECDQCNEIFGRYENDLGNFAGIWHTLSMVSGGRGVPKFKNNKNDFVVTGDDGKIRISIDKTSEGRQGHIELGNEKLTIDTFNLPFVPKDALKAFIKIALTFMDKETILNYDKTRRWLIGEINNEDIAMHPYFFVPRAMGSKMFKSPLIMLMRKRKAIKATPFAIPEHSLLVFYGVFIYQIYIPFHQNEESEFRKGKLFLPVEEHLCKEIPSDSPLGAASINYMNMGANVKVKNVAEKIELPLN